MPEHKGPETLDAAPPTERADQPCDPSAKVRPFVEPSISPPSDILGNTKFFALGSLPPAPPPRSNRPAQPAPNPNRS